MKRHQAPIVCCVSSLVCLVVSVLSLRAQSTVPYQPKLSDSKDSARQHFPMGVLSATGQVIDGQRTITVIDVGKDGLAQRGGLRVGDVIVTIDGASPRAFSKTTDSGLAGPQTALASALERAGSTSPHHLRLGVVQGGESQDLVVEVPASGAFAQSFPRGCAKRERYLKQIAKYLASIQRPDGSWQPGVGGDADVYMSAFCALSLLAANDKAYLPQIKEAIEFIRKKSISQIRRDDPKVGPKSWQACSSAILLAEYYLATGDESVLRDLQKCSDLLSQRVSLSGTMGHHYVVGYDGGGLVIINSQAHIAWALAEKCGVSIDGEAWDRSMKEMEKSIDKRTGAIGYSSRAPSSPDISARTGAMAVALAVRSSRPELVKQFSDALVKHHGRMRHAHAMSSIGLIFGFAGIKSANRQDHDTVMRQWIPYFELCRTHAGTAAYFGGKRNYTGDAYLGLHPMGNAMVALMLASSDDHLFLFGGREANWLVAER